MKITKTARLKDTERHDPRFTITFDDGSTVTGAYVTRMAIPHYSNGDMGTPYEESSFVPESYSLISAAIIAEVMQVIIDEGSYYEYSESHGDVVVLQAGNLEWRIKDTLGDMIDEQIESFWNSKESK